MEIYAANSMFRTLTATGMKGLITIADDVWRVEKLINDGANVIDLADL
jgi:hypothetical protein